MLSENDVDMPVFVSIFCNEVTPATADIVLSQPKKDGNPRKTDQINFSSCATSKDDCAVKEYFKKIGNREHK